MDTRQLKSLIAIAEKGTFAEAARTVSLTSSAISQQMQALEQELGAPLFDRSTRPSTLNAQGLQMVETAKAMLSNLEEAKASIAGHRIGGTLDLGAVRTSALTLIPRAIVTLRRTYPDLKIKLRVGHSDALLADVVAGRIDAAMIAEHMAIPKGLQWRPFIREPLLVIAPAGTPPGNAHDLLTRLPYIRFSSNVPLAHIIDTEMAHMGIVPTEVAEMDTVWAIASCVAQGLGVAVVPHLVFRNPENAALVSTAFGRPPVYRQIGLVQQIRNPRRDLISNLHAQLAAISAPHGVVQEWIQAARV